MDRQNKRQTWKVESKRITLFHVIGLVSAIERIYRKKLKSSVYLKKKQRKKKELGKSMITTWLDSLGANIIPMHNNCDCICKGYLQNFTSNFGIFNAATQSYAGFVRK